MANRLPARSEQDSKSKPSARAEMRRQRRCLVIGLGAASALTTNLVPLRAAYGAPPPSLRVVGQDAACPTASQVATMLERMLPRTKITADGGPSGAAEATVSDQGAHFRVTVAGQERSFDDGTRQCAERARHAAVFVALVLDPPLISELPSESSERPQAPPVPPVDAARPSERRTTGLEWDVTIGAAMLVAPEAERRSTAVAEGIAAFVRAKHGFHLALGAGVLHGALHFDAADADAWWIPLDAAVGFTSRPRAWEMGAEIGPSASVLFIIGENLKEARREVRVEVGGRASAWSRFWFTKQFAAFLSAEAVVRPFPHVLDIDPRGGVGEMPVVWLGGSAGLAAAFQ